MLTIKIDRMIYDNLVFKKRCDLPSPVESNLIAEYFFNNGYAFSIQLLEGEKKLFTVFRKENKKYLPVIDPDFYPKLNKDSFLKGCVYGSQEDMLACIDFLTNDLKFK